MKVQLIKHTIRPDGLPIKLEIASKVFEGPDATSILTQVRLYLATVIPHIPFTHKDDQARAALLQGTNAYLAKLLAEYFTLPIPGNDAAAITELAAAGYLTVLEP